jgi:hypothetical protein
VDLEAGGLTLKPWERDELVQQTFAGRRVNPKGWARANCCFCPMRVGTDDRKQCMGLNVTSGKYHCFRCGTRGRLDSPEEFELWRPAEGGEREELQAMDPPEGFFPLFEGAGLSSFFMEPARAYVLRRGVPQEVGRQVQIGFTMQGQFAGRVIIPVLGEDDAWFGWTGRHLDPTVDRKVMYPSGMVRAELVYNHMSMLQKSEHPVLVTEGAFDALSVWPHGVACLGKPSPEQVEAFIACGRDIAVVLDGDAHHEAEVLAMRLRFEGVRAGSVRLPPTKDPNTVPREQLLKAALACVERQDHIGLNDV